MFFDTVRAILGLPSTCIESFGHTNCLLSSNVVNVEASDSSFQVDTKERVHLVPQGILSARMAYNQVPLTDELQDCHYGFFVQISIARAFSSSMRISACNGEMSRGGYAESTIPLLPQPCLSSAHPIMWL